MAVNDAVNAASAKYQEAAEALMRVVKRAYPVGCVVAVTLGRARVIGEVTGHSNSWWYHPSTVVIRNLRTGKTRDFAADSDLYDPEIQQKGTA